MLYLLVFLFLAVLLYVVNRQVNRRRWQLLDKVPGRTAFPLIGNITDVMMISTLDSINPITYFFQYQQGMDLMFKNEKLHIMWMGRHPIVFLSAPETVEPLFSSNTALEKGTFYKFIKPWLGDGLVMSSGDKWRRHRKFLTPSFHFRILDNFVPVMNEHASILVQKISAASATKDWVDSFDYYSKCTLDIICETSMGIKIDAQETDSTYSGMIHKVTSNLTVRSSKPWLNWDKIYFMTKAGKEFKNAVNFLHSVTDKVINERLAERKYSSSPTDVSPECETGGKKRLAFLDLLLESGMSRQETREQVDTFMFAGHDTTATSLSWMTYLLGLHPDIQDKLIEEVDRVFGDDTERHVTQQDLRDLKYMDQVMKECQRVYPSVPGVSRTLDKDTEFGGYLIPKGTECFLSIYSVHHHPDHYPNPEVFDPERFTAENSVGRHPYAFVPFSAGPRNCIGQRFALMEQKILACHIFRHFRVHSLDQRDKIYLIPELVMKTDPRIRTRFLPRTSKDC